MLRGLLGLGREEMRLTGCTFAVPVTATRTRTEVLTAGEVVLKEQRHVLFEYESGCSAVYDLYVGPVPQPDPPPDAPAAGVPAGSWTTGRSAG